MLEKDYGGRQFNMVFINWYMNGNQYIGYHPDSEDELYKNERGETLVFSISFGAERRFLLKSIATKKVKEFKLGDNSCLLMAGLCQKEFKHSVPKEPKVLGKRVNLTFRIFKPPKLPRVPSQ
jgi:alkylated DNA repair dioxygenase AlkB